MHAPSGAAVGAKPLFDKILIANRGEIACRVMRTARRLGINTVAVYSEADRDALHVKMADEAYLIGPPPSADSYLRMDRILDVVHRSGAQAVHPGYGFLSENAAFSDLLQQNGVTFIGPPAAAMISMGSKSESKNIMQAASVPVVPGYHGEKQDVEFLKTQADKIGYPVLIKAIKGGGGKGMRIVERPEDFEEMLASSKREGLKSFGDDQVLVEKYLVTPRHVEVQVFADKLGNAVHLHERDCSVQRRHQKILEEAPAPMLSESVRALLGEKAVAAAKAVDYVGAGTVEFIFDNADGKFYFMEMNTRLQVEHPVTEMITGTDLVQWQLEVAAGNPLPLKQEQILANGHAFEARIYAENPTKGFLPDVGPLLHVRSPHIYDPAVIRLETGVRQGDQVSVHYDPMISKLVVHGRDRHEALRLLRRSLQQYQVVGLNTNIDFLKTVIDHPAFIAGDVETGFIQKHDADLFPAPTPAAADVVAQAALAIVLRQQRQTTTAAADPYSPWRSLQHWRPGYERAQRVTLQDGDHGLVHIDVTRQSDGSFGVTVEPAGTDATAVTRFDNVRAEIPMDDAEVVQVDLLDRRLRTSVVLEADTGRLHVFAEKGKRTFQLPAPKYLTAAAGDIAAGSVVAPMPCKISQVMVAPGQTVEKGTPLIVLEAMKMEHVIKAPKAGTVDRIIFGVGELAGEGKLLVAFKPDPEDAAAEKNA
ncbi:carbamoyl-phosphate synthase L chain, ATP binding domain-containing protein [Thamnocephalis sphaerospora]|uniref:Carbamoyl-phosphate synthase L chain, ATP binding domain-containing protein n=1 Tax=Thamnocephalis sphaerospora TaxID=78915 RepID=A0A4P9XRY5_9FUNG|nr:carbamoyl-phosphate synthase L chain, ATP binding domain-containing protein [Thamnocephalis sphaerospora]|eukprot:RKP08848.1 carbamoyl-phosphate synthase L chain, ATP binding domain-containing protein [Thamnocephalis sphaerospora]